MKRVVAFWVVLGLAAGCGGDPEPSFSAPVITEVTVSAEAQRADIAFRVTGGEASRCGVNYWEDAPGATVMRVEGSLNEELAEVKLSRLTAGTGYRFTPWADNGKFEIKGEEQTFETEPLAEVRIYDFICYAPTTSSVKASFRYTAPERVISACLWYWPADAAGISDPTAKRIPITALASGEVSVTLSGLTPNTAYKAQPFIYTEEGEIAGSVQQFSTSSANVSIVWDSLYSDTSIPNVIHIDFYVVDPDNQYWLRYFAIQEGDCITFDENTLIDGPYQGRGRINLMYRFAKTETQYTVLPFIRGTEDFMGTPRTVTTGTRTKYEYVDLANGGRWSLNKSVPDAAFRQYLVEHFDKDGDGNLSGDEANDVKHIDCRNLGITSLAGIERFQNLLSVNCSGNPIREIDLRLSASFFILADYYSTPKYLKEFTALDMNDSSGNNVLKYLIIGGIPKTKISVPEECVIQYIE